MSGSEDRSAASSVDASRTNWWEIVATVILSLATVATAWSGYQAARWGGEQTKANRAASAYRTESTRQSNLASQQAAVDVSVFLAWLDAVAGGDETLQDFIEQRFRADFVPAFEAWLELAPAGEIPPGTPFTLDAYEIPAAVEAERLLGEAEEAVERADTANQNGDNFVLTAVLYASVLFFGGISSKMTSLRATQIAVGMGTAMFLIASIVLVTLPWNVGF